MYACMIVCTCVHTCIHACRGVHPPWSIEACFPASDRVLTGGGGCKSENFPKGINYASKNIRARNKYENPLFIFMGVYKCKHLKRGHSTDWTEKKTWKRLSRTLLPHHFQAVRTFFQLTPLFNHFPSVFHIKQVASWLTLSGRLCMHAL